MNPLKILLLLVWLPVTGGIGKDIEVIPAAFRGAAQPQVAVAPDGRVFVSFGHGTGIFCAAADAALNFRTPVRIGELPKLALGVRRGPRVAVAGNSVVVSAISHADGNLHAWNSTDGGVTWSGPAQVNSVANSAREGMHAMVGDGKGLVFAAWLDLRHKGTELWGASSRDGGRTWARNVLIYQSPDGTICQCCHPTLVGDGSGLLWAMWRNFVGGSRDLYFARSGDGGETFSSATKLGSGTWQLNACPMDGGSAVVLSDGELLTTWRRDKSLFIAAGNSERLLSAAGLHPVIGWNRSAPFYLWQEGLKLMWRNGDKSAEVFADRGAFAAVASPPPGSRPMVVWEGSTDGAKTIFVRRIEE